MKQESTYYSDYVHVEMAEMFLEQYSRVQLHFIPILQLLIIALNVLKVVRAFERGN